GRVFVAEGGACADVALLVELAVIDRDARRVQVVDVDGAVERQRDGGADFVRRTDERRACRPGVGRAALATPAHERRHEDGRLLEGSGHVFGKRRCDGETKRRRAGGVIGHWSLVIGHWSLVTCHWSLVIGHLCGGRGAGTHCL